jgi:hypothetical protein
VDRILIRSASPKLGYKRDRQAPRLVVVLAKIIREDTMGFFDILIGRTPGPPKKLFARFKRKSRAPTDFDLLKIAKDRKGHISRRAVHVEYNRLILEKYAHDKA